MGLYKESCDLVKPVITICVTCKINPFHGEELEE